MIESRRLGTEAASSSRITGRPRILIFRDPNAILIPHTEPRPSSPPGCGNAGSNLAACAGRPSSHPAWQVARPPSCAHSDEADHLFQSDPTTPPPSSILWDLREAGRGGRWLSVRFHRIYVSCASNRAPSQQALVGAPVTMVGFPVTEVAFARNTQSWPTRAGPAPRRARTPPGGRCRCQAERCPRA